MSVLSQGSNLQRHLLDHKVSSSLSNAQWRGSTKKLLPPDNVQKQPATKRAADRDTMPTDDDDYFSF
uniref:Uncharacterized protein n=1 Tax=Arundo donax TaxID=35708 RepID=A0A0A9FEK9_ARUDO